LLSTVSRSDPNNLGEKSKQKRANAIRATENKMKKDYDFSKGVKNPYAKRLKRQLTIRLDHDTIEYFRKMADELGIPYQTLMNMYLRECAVTGKRLRLHWKPNSEKRAA